MTLNDLEKFLKRAKTPSEIFGNDLDGAYRSFALICHPDRNPDEKDYAKQVFLLLEEWKAKAIGPKAVVKSPTRSYEVLGNIASGDISDIYDAGDYILKISHSKRDGDLLLHEAQVIKELQSHPNVATFSAYLPKVIEVFRIRGNKVVLVMAYNRQYEPLTKFSELGPKTSVWIFKRLLSILGYVHQIGGIVHCGILPPHILINPNDHGLKLIDWSLSLKVGETLKAIPPDFKDYYPPEVFEKQPINWALDIFMAAKTIQSCCNLTKRMKNFTDTCMMKNPKMRPDNAWELYDDWDLMTLNTFGKAKFIKDLAK